MVSSQVDKPKLLVICGPTGSGKGQLARAIAASLNGELVSADSRKIYRKFDIGTAKTPLQERKNIIHHMVDVCDPHEVFTAGKFAKLADQAIEQIRSRGRIPIVVGGTGLYIRVLLHGIVEAPVRDDNLRKRLLKEENENPGILYEKLTELDPLVAERLPDNDLVRIVRALEVGMLSGVRFSKLQKSHGFNEQCYRSYQIAPDWSRELLYQRIDARVDRMMIAGWLEEVRNLVKQGLESTPAFQAVGYRQLLDHLQGKIGVEEAVIKIKTEHRRYARKQIMWFRGVEDLRWLEMPYDESKLLEEIGEVLRR